MELKSPELKKYQNNGNLPLISLIPKNANCILDVGCGSGDNARILNAAKKKVDCITISKEEVDIARNFCDNIYLKNLEEGLPNEIMANKYDVIICSHVLEHIAYPSRLLRDIKKLMKPFDTVLLVALPNFLSYKNRLNILFGKFNYEKTGIMDYTHLRWYTYKTGKQLLIENGFTLTNITIDGNIPLASYLNFLPEKFKIYIRNILFNVSPGLFGGQFIYSCIIERTN